MERKVQMERTKPVPKGLNITPGDIAAQIKHYQNRPDLIKRPNGYPPSTFGGMCEERLRALTSSPPEVTIKKLEEIYAFTEGLRSQGLDILDITTQTIRKYRSVVDYVDLFNATGNKFLDEVADNEWEAWNNEWKRLKQTFINCEIALTLEDYNAVDRDAPQRLQDNPGKTMAELMTDKEEMDYIMESRKRYVWDLIQKKKFISEHGEAEFERGVKNMGFTSIIQWGIDKHVETLKYLESIGKIDRGLREMMLWR